MIELSFYSIFKCKMKYFPKVSWGNIYLSPLNVEDYEIITWRLNNPKITDGTHWWPRMITLQKEREWLESLSKNWNYTFEIIRKQWDKLIWIISLNNTNYINQTAELWISIWETDEHNKWYWTDAINALLSYAYNTLNLYNISLWVKTFNKNAIACYKKCWFKEVWKKHHCEYCNWKRYDWILMEILKPDWVKKNK